MAKRVIDADTILNQAKPSTHQRAHEIQPFGHLVKLPHMAEARARTSPTAVPARPRKIIRRTRGNRHGPITRLMSPSDLGQMLKPFVFLDLFDMENATFQGMGLHPHSGIATVSYLFEAFGIEERMLSEMTVAQRRRLNETLRRLVENLRTS
jgi:hypothetical protein